MVSAAVGTGGVAGLTPSVRAATTMVPGPRPRVVLGDVGVTPTVRPAILKRDPQRVVSGTAPKPRATTGRATAPRGTVGSPKLPTKVQSPATQTRDDVTGVTPDTGTPAATGSPKVPAKASGTANVPKPRVVPKRK